eukprot:754880-Hanusia_phi.AAC.2
MNRVEVGGGWGMVKGAEGGVGGVSTYEKGEAERPQIRMLSGKGEYPHFLLRCPEGASTRTPGSDESPDSVSAVPGCRFPTEPGRRGRAVIRARAMQAAYWGPGLSAAAAARSLPVSPYCGTTAQ